MASSSNRADAARGFIPAQNTEEKLLQRRVADMVKAVSATGRARFTAFLSDREAALATAQLNRQGWQSFVFCGGCNGAERTVLCVYYDEVPPFPVVALRLQTGAEGLTHRDYLGSLMGLGIKRECLGDILVQQGCATVYLLQGMAQLVQDELREVGRHAVQVSSVLGRVEDTAADGPAGTFTATVASLRLDAVLAAMLRSSRGEAARRIKRGEVQINHIEATKPDGAVYAGDVFSLRGTGKFKLEEIGGASRKNRIFIQFLKY